jgi:uncharacterized protein (TIGR03083 family)
MDHLEHCAALEIEIGRFAEVLDAATPEAMVPTCPDWSVQELATHLGTVHRWAEHLVSTLSPARVPPGSLGLDVSSINGEWIRTGGVDLLGSLRDGDPDAAMWAWGVDQHLRWWSRRQLHETLVHRVDLEIAVGGTPAAEPHIAADAIDEFLVNLDAAGRFSPRVREIRGAGEVLVVQANDINARWAIQLTPQGFTLVDTSTPASATLEGPARDLLLVLYRRRSLASSAVMSSGDESVSDYWLEHSALE